MTRSGLVALTLTEPWATLVMLGAKRYETRSWTTQRRGRILIHAAKGMPGWAREACHDEPFATVLKAAFETSLVAEVLAALDARRGKILGAVTLEGIFHTERIVETLPAQEVAFGDYAMGRFAWLVSNPCPFEEFVPTRGALGLWPVPEGALL